jgi:DNA-binding HxlR family transcriptional regulator
VVAVLVEQEQRFTTIQRSVQSISHRMLTKTLRDLERDGLVARKIYAEVPPRVEYGLTPLGRTLLIAIDGLIQWVDDHGHTVLTNRLRATPPAQGGNPSVSAASPTRPHSRSLP